MAGSVRRLVVIAALLVAACGSGNSGESAGSANAGTVVELAGEVTAARAAQGSPTRPLARGDVVFADDTITTASDASVTIELTHNGARWSLTGGASRRVDRSPAWRAAKSGGGSLLSATERDRTAAAGRHAERSAAERTATPQTEMKEREVEEPTTGAMPDMPAEAEAMEEAMPEPVAEPPAAPEPEPAGALPPPPPPAPEPEPEPEPRDEVVKKRAKRSSRSERRLGGSSAKSSRDDATDGAIDDLLAPPKADAPAKLTREQVLSTISRMRKALAQCATAHDGKGQTVKVAFVVAPDGGPRDVRAQSPHAGTPLGRCVETAVKQTRFPQATGDTPVTFPFRL